MKHFAMDHMSSLGQEKGPSPLDGPEWGMEEVFTMYPKCTAHLCKVDPSGFSYKRLDGNDQGWTILKQRDIIGCVCMHERASVRKNYSHFYLSVYAYPLRGKLFSKGQRRLRHNVVFKVDAHAGDRAANLALATRWTKAIISLARNVPFDENDPVHRRRHLLVFVNPHSGAGRAMTLFRQRVVPILAEAAVSYDLVVTESQNFALNYVKTADLRKWHGIVTSSGDGLVYEVINGIMERDDWELAIKTPLGIIPGGSGNGLAIAISHALREPADTHRVLFGALTVVKGHQTPMDLVRVETPGKVMYSFLSVGWGIMADIDIESERLRVIGGSRFTLWAFARVIGLRMYRGRVSFLRVEGYSSPSPGKKAKRPFGVHNHSKSYPASLDQAHKDRNSSGLEYTHSDLDVSSPTPTAESVSFNGHVKYGEGVEVDMPKLDEPVPSSWETIEDDFVAVHTAFQSHIGNGVFLAPEATLDDGVIWMVIVRNGITRPQLIEFLLSLESGGHVDLAYVEVFPVRAFRIEPSGSGGILTVDGETVDYGPIQANVIPSAARIMTL